MSFAEKWMELKIMLNEISRTHKDKYGMISLIYRIQNFEKEKGNVKGNHWGRGIRGRE
jgi:hypothetical protein